MTTIVVVITNVTMSVQERVAFVRSMAGISAREFDRLSGLAPGHTRLIETGKRSSQEVDTVRGIAQAVGCSLDWLCNGIGEAPTQDQIVAAIARARAEHGDRESGPIVDPDATIEPGAA